MITEINPPVIEHKKVSKKERPAAGPAIGVNINFQVLKRTNDK